MKMIHFAVLNHLKHFQKEIVPISIIFLEFFIWRIYLFLDFFIPRIKATVPTRHIRRARYRLTEIITI